MVDFPSETRNAVVVGTTQVATFPGSMNERFIDRVNINGPAGSTCILYVGAIGSGFQRDGSSSGQQDTAEYPNGLYVPAGSSVYLVWNLTGSPAAFGNVQWRVVN